jgi:hypothetical protein
VKINLPLGGAMNQITFGQLDDQIRRKKQSMLDDVNNVIDFKRIEKLLLKMYKGGGRPPIPPVMLFKALLLESWYGLSDVQVVQEIHDRRSFERCVGLPLNDRQIKLINQLLDGFEGKLTSSKWAAIAKCSPDSALRDINDLIERGVMKKATGGGRSTSYELVGE